MGPHKTDVLYAKLMSYLDKGLVMMKKQVSGIAV
jgi:hypothetical protein